MYAMISSILNTASTGTPNSSSTSCTVDLAPVPRSCRSTSWTMPTSSASGWVLRISMACRIAVPEVRTSSMITTRPLRGAPTIVPPSPCCGCQYQPRLCHTSVTAKRRPQFGTTDSSQHAVDRKGGQSLGRSAKWRHLEKMMYDIVRSRPTHVLLLLAVVRVPHLDPLVLRQRHGRDRREGDTLVGGPEEHVKLGNPGRGDHLGKRVGGRGEEGTGVQQARV